MADPLYPGDYYMDPSLGIKLEPGMDALVTSASVPIPSRRLHDMDFTFELNTDPFNESSPLVSNENTLEASNMSDNSLWGRELRIETFRMDEEDLFQVDKSDLIQDPTLAELNANEDQLLTGDLNFDDLMLPGDNSLFSVPSVTMSQVESLSPAPPSDAASSQSQAHLSVNTSFTASSFPPAGLGFLKDGLNSSSSVPSSPLDIQYLPSVSSALSPSSHHSSGSSPAAPRHSTLHELLLKREPLGRSVPAASPPLRGLVRTRPNSHLSSSAPTHLGFEQIWQRREPRQHLLSTGSLAEAGSTSSLSTGGVLSPESHEFSHDEGSDTDEESDRFEYDEATSDGDSSDGEGDKDRISKAAVKKERFFWQYNVQAKGPKGQRLVLKTKQEDPHVLNEVTDPVFSPSCAVRGIKHSGKARKGDGNDLTPNPRKLQSIGKELDKLSKVINDITPVSELPFNIRPKTRKEKNKLASRACRLKKKAQHEANKIKLFGLEHEHRKLLNGIQQMKLLLIAKFNADASRQEELNKHCDKTVKSATKIKIAGHTTDYVNRVLEKVRNGVPDGGLTDF